MQNLKDHIDEPMLKVIAGLNLIGFKTWMSCCGFKYKGEKVKKSHLGKPYVYLDYKQISEDFFLRDVLCDLSLKSDWIFCKRLPFIDFYAEVWKDNHVWKEKESVHNYESYVLSISALNRAILDRDFNFKDKVTISDGNKFYKEKVSSYWQYEPTEDWVVTKEEYLAMPM